MAAPSMASLALSDPDFMEMYKQVLANSRWQNQLASGLGIANAGWKTGLGLNLGTLIGRWLGHKFGNWQQDRKDRYKWGDGSDTRTPQEAYANLFNQGDFDLGWQPSPYWNTADYSWQASPQIYNQDWRQSMVNRALPIPYWQPDLTSATASNIAPVAQTAAQAPTINTVTPQANPPPKPPDDIVTFDFTKPQINSAAGQASIRNSFDANKYGWSLQNPYAKANPYAFSATLRDYNPYLRW